MNTGVYLYKTVISATGIFGSPVMPEIPGMTDFQGEVYHAHEFKDPQQVKNQRVLVVGSGPSGVDIAVAAAEVAASVKIAIRSGITLKRRYPFGLPSHFWMMLGLMLPEKWCNRLMKWVGKQGYPDQEKYGLKKPAPGEGGITAYQGPELLNAVKAGKVTPVPAPVQFDAGGATLADGTYQALDTVIMATGYVPVLHQYLNIEMQYNDHFWEAPAPCEWEIGPNGQRGFPLLDRNQHPNGRQVLGHPGLFIVGVYYKGKGAMHNMNIEAAIAAQQIQAYLAEFPEKQPEVDHHFHHRDTETAEGFTEKS
jgi:cation diffusion facilitator CzcD-associated flavoprotein CzcO